MYISFIFDLVYSHSKLFSGTVEVERGGVGEKCQWGGQEFQKRSFRRLDSVAAGRK